ncbi:GNAT family N-acetyltransferase [Oceanirhabdus sp. W0125-5]|uniref:GNAT family N-acetyltransferase n=1 Tax=Oceanirhabdus sp. W0125-5 TaxID=2999116 RepID=UPI0022F2D442|nr:GNAT family N-acetyltransferase [Oceanirhabdus sp. W0125-5]WBW97813.1 GNAT family N-acetyltransferase [Oceanirhabdus sp. W0125-5]
MKDYIIKTNRLGLRKWNPEDLIPFTEMNSDPKVMEFFTNTLTKEESYAFANRVISHFDSHGFGLYAVDVLSSGEFIGYIGLSIPKFEAYFTPCVEIGWRIAHKYWGKGYAPEGAKACIKYAFETLNISEIVSFTASINKRSIRVMEKIGMDYCGTFKHPKVDINSPLYEHVLYKIEK